MMAMTRSSQPEMDAIADKRKLCEQYERRCRRFDATEAAHAS